MFIHKETRGGKMFRLRKILAAGVIGLHVPVSLFAADRLTFVLYLHYRLDPASLGRAGSGLV